MDTFIKKAEEFYSYQSGWKEELLYTHAGAIVDEWNGVKEEALIMKDISIEQLKSILYDGYTVRER